MVRRQVSPISRSSSVNFDAIQSSDKQRYVLAGIVAGGRGCGRPDTPGIYVDPQKHLSWIINTIERN